MTIQVLQDTEEDASPQRSVFTPPRSATFKDINPDYDGSESGEFLYGTNAKLGRLALLFADTANRMFFSTRNVKGELSAMLFDQMVDVPTAQGMMLDLIAELLKANEPTVVLLKANSQLQVSPGGGYVLVLKLYDASSGQTAEQRVSVRGN